MCVYQKHVLQSIILEKVFIKYEYISILRTFQSVKTYGSNEGFFFLHKVFDYNETSFLYGNVFFNPALLSVLLKQHF